MRISLLVPVCTFVAFLGACSGQPARDAAAVKGRPAAAPSTATPATPDGDVQTVSGTVMETMNAASYTYVRVKTSSGEVWAATSQMPIAVGDRVSVPLQMPMKDFHSPSLKRDFPLIYFVTHIDREGEPSASPSPTMASHGQAPAASTPSQSAQANTPVAQPAGGTTVATVWAQRQALAGKAVTVRGRVVKFNGGILDRNWLHIQDGTGNATDGSNDLLVTSQGEAKVGDVITATGKVAVNRDFGAGYAYAVMIEGATIK